MGELKNNPCQRIQFYNIPANFHPSKEILIFFLGLLLCTIIVSPELLLVAVSQTICIGFCSLLEATEAFWELGASAAESNVSPE